MKAKSIMLQMYVCTEAMCNETCGDPTCDTECFNQHLVDTMEVDLETGEIDNFD